MCLGEVQALNALALRHDDVEAGVLLATALVPFALRLAEGMGRGPQPETAMRLVGFYRELPDDYTTGDFLATGSRIGIGERSACGYNACLVKQGLVRRTDRGQYVKEDRR